MPSWQGSGLARFKSSKQVKLPKGWESVGDVFKFVVALRERLE